jgi:Lipocalin-like domain
MSSTLRLSPCRFIVVIAAMAFTLFAHAQSAEKVSSSGGAKEKLVGAWHLVHIDAPGPDGNSVPVPQPKGILIYTRDGHMSVQLMYPESANTLSNEYVLNGYEASFGSYDVDETAHTVTHHVLGSNTRDLLVGKDLPRKFEFAADGYLIIRSARTDEHWSVTWAHY